MNSQARPVALFATAALLAALVASPAPARAQDDYDWDALDAAEAIADGSGEAAASDALDTAQDEADDVYDWDALDEAEAEGESTVEAVEEVTDEATDGYDWDELDEAEADTDDFDWDALDEAEEDDDFDWENFDDAEAEDDTDWDSYWDELDSYEEEVEEVEVPTEVAEDSGGVQGQVVDDETDSPFPRANVSISGTDFETLTDAEGRFFFELEPGTYVLRVDHFELSAVSYQVLVEPGEITDLATIRMRPSENTSTIVVEGRAVQESTAQQLMERQESATVQDAVSAEQISQAGDSSAASAVRRVVGVTLVDDRFLVVRGLSGRYTQVTLNGVPVPLTDPDYPSAEVDLFPTELLSSLTLAKNPTADLSSFTGGLMNVETRAYPEEFEFTLSLSAGGDTHTTFQDFQRDPLGSRDALGFDDGSRDWPTMPSSEPLDRRTIDNYEEIAHGMPNSWESETVTARPDLGGKLTLGDTVELGDRDLGYLLIASYSNGFERRESTRATTRLEDDELVIRERLDIEQFQMKTTWGTLGNLSLELADGHSLRAVSLWNHTGRESFETASGPSDEEDGDLLRSSWNWTQRSLVFNQLIGSHRRLLPEASPLHEMRLDWTAALGIGRRDQPDTRYYKEIDGTWDVNPGSGEHFRTELDQRDIFGTLDWHIPYLDAFATTVGGSVHSIERDFSSRRLRYTTPLNGVDPDFFDLPASEQFSDANVTADGTPVRLREFPNDGDSYEISQFTAAGYLTAEVAPVDWLRITGGARYQTTTQDVADVPLDGEPDPDNEVHRVDQDVLASGAVHVEVVDDVFLRAVYGGSVAYPQMREIAPFRVQNYRDRRTETGNPDLIRTYVHNFDLRAEWFPSATEVVAMSAFYKGFLHPIEPTQINRQGDVLYLNADGATNLGLELEAQVDLGRIGERARGLYVGANAAFIRSRIDLPCNDVDGDGECDGYTNEERPMQGQAPWQVNARFGWDPDDLGLSLGLVFAALAPTLDNPGLLGRPDEYSQPTRQLDFIAGYEFDEHWKLSLKVQNLLFSESIDTAGDLTTGRGFEPMEFSVGLRWQY